MKLNDIVRKAALYTAIGATAVTGVGMARNAEATDLAEAKTIVVTPFKGGDGANGSQWYGPVRISNTSHNETADGIVYVLPQQSNALANAPQFEYHIPARQSLIIDNLWQYFADNGNPQTDFGNVSLRVEPTDGIDISVAAFVKNEQNLNEDNAYVVDPHNTNITTTDLLQGLQGVGDSEFLLPGDYVTIMAPSVQLQEYGDPVRTKEMNRLNLFTYGRQDSFGNNPEMYCELFHEDGTPLEAKWFAGNTNGGTQITNFIKSPAGMHRTPEGNENIKCTVTKGEMIIMPSVAKNNVDLPGVDDGYSMIPEITRLVEEMSYTSSPNLVEANDPTVLSVKVKTRFGADIEGCQITGGIGANIGGEGTEFTYHRTEYPTAPGTYENQLGCTINTDYGQFIRVTTPHLLDIMAEQDYFPEDSYETTQQNRQQLAEFIGNNVNTVYLGDKKHYDTDDMQLFLEAYTNGIVAPNDPEITSVSIIDTYNRLHFSLETDSGTANAVWGGFTEPQMDWLEDFYKPE